MLKSDYIYHILHDLFLSKKIMKNTTLPILITLTLIYFLLKYVVPYGEYIIYPISLLVTFMHEFWHAFFAMMTGWHVHELQVNSDGSWLATTSGWWRSFILMWWYIWSALFGNILLRIWLQDWNKLSERTLYAMAILLVIVWILWFSSILSFVILLILALILMLLAKFTSYDKVILQFLWVASILFIIEDFNVWPSSDLSKFSEIFIIIPQSIWMIIWLIIVLVISWLNIKSILFKK